MKMRYLVIAMLLCPWAPVQAAGDRPSQVSIDIGYPGINLGFNFPEYPELIQVPDYPVYYAPRADSNYFFYDGLYWVFYQDDWYASSWYNGPWDRVKRDYVPLYVLRVPVRYYRQPPAYFRGWRDDAPPRWGEHWGRDWEDLRSGWDRWDRRAAPPLAPLPIYQRQYSGARYPRAPEQQRSIRSENYRYQPRETVTQRRYQQPAQQNQQWQERRQQEQQQQVQQQQQELQRQQVQQQQQELQQQRAQQQQQELQRQQAQQRQQQSQRPQPEHQGKDWKDKNEEQRNQDRGAEPQRKGWKDKDEEQRNQGREAEPRDFRFQRP